MSVLRLNVCRLYVPNIMSLGIRFIKKIAPRQSWRVCLIRCQNSRYFQYPVWKTKSWYKKANLHENWNMQTLF